MNEIVSGGALYCAAACPDGDHHRLRFLLGEEVFDRADDVAVEAAAQTFIAGDDDIADFFDLALTGQEILRDVLLGIVEDLRDHVLDQVEVRIGLLILRFGFIEFCGRQQTHGVGDALHARDALDPPFYVLCIRL